MAAELYRVVNRIGRIILDEAGNPVDGYHIDFITKSGARGFVEIPEAQYSKELAAEKLKAEAERLEEMLKL